MILVTITVAALVATSVMGYLTISYKNKAKDSATKFQATKEFADSAASKILRLESDSKAMSAEIVRLSNELVLKGALSPKPVQEVAPQSQQKPKKSKKRFYKAKKENNN